MEWDLVSMSHATLAQFHISPKTADQIYEEQALTKSRHLEIIILFDKFLRYVPAQLAGAVKNKSCISAVR